MEELRNLGVDIDYLLQQIENMKIDEVKELKDIYGDKWSSISKVTVVGKVFSKVVSNSANKIKLLEINPKQSDNHSLYKRIA